MTLARAPRLLALLLGLAVASTAALELGLRGWLVRQGQPGDQSAILAELRAATSALELPIGEHPPPGGSPLPGNVPHPYLGWADPAALRDEVRHAAAAREPTDFEVVLVGGPLASALAGEGEPLLRRALAGDPRLAGRSLRLLYLGHPAYKQPQQLNAVDLYFALGGRPDLVIAVDGPNELALGDANRGLDIHPLQPYGPLWQHLDLSEGSDGLAVDHLLDAHEARKRALAWMRRLERVAWTHSVLLAVLPRARILAARSRFDDAVGEFERLATSERPLAVRGPPVKLDREGGLELVASQWFLCSRMLAASCRAHGADYLHVLAPEEPAAVRATVRAAGLPGEELPDAAAALRDGYPRLRALGADLAERGIAFVDASRPVAGAAAGGGDAEAELTELAERVASAYLAREGSQ